MVANSEIIENKKGIYQANIDKNHHLGIIDITSSKNGYFICKNFKKDVFIPFNNLGKALQDDTVRAYVYRKSKSNQLEAKITQIVERKKKPL